MSTSLADELRAWKPEESDFVVLARSDWLLVREAANSVRPWFPQLDDIDIIPLIMEDDE